MGLNVSGNSFEIPIHFLDTSLNPLDLSIVRKVFQYGTRHLIEIHRRFNEFAAHFTEFPGHFHCVQAVFFQYGIGHVI